MSFINPNVYDISGNNIHSFLQSITADEMEYFEERAAILEYEAGLSRDEAELRALEYLLWQRKPVSKAG